MGTRRGHASQLSISDPSHHVTEAIGTLYGDEDDSGSESARPLSFVHGSSYDDQIQRPSQPELREPLDPHQQPRRPSVSSPPPNPPTSHGEHGSIRKPQRPTILSPSQRSSSFEHESKSPSSPTLSLRDVQAVPAGSQFPLTNIDNPSDIAQELSNLQALRRLSMDVGNNIDPDMPPMSLSAMPVIAPSGDDDENDPSRLLWVPARVHPELAPTEFKSFLEKRVQSIRRRSGDAFFSADGDLSRGSSESFLRRKKSMLSRQIDASGGRGPIGYVDGAERLDRPLSSGSQHSQDLSLEELVKDPEKAVQRFAQETQGGSRSTEDSDDDMPILPMAPGVSLRRSTRTTYRKGGSLRSGDRGSLSKRLAHRHHDSVSSEAGASSASEAIKGLTPARVQSAPMVEHYLQTGRPVWRQNDSSQEPSATLAGADGPLEDSVEPRTPSTHAHQEKLPVRISSAPVSPTNKESPTPQERTERLDNQNTRSFPARTSSQQTGSSRDRQPEVIPEEAPARSSRRSTNSNIVKQSTQTQYTSKPLPSVQVQTMSGALASPSSLSGGDASRTDSLTFIPTLSQPEKKPEKKLKKDRDDDSTSAPSSRSSGAWKWLKGVADDRDRKKEESKKSKSKVVAERAQDNVRLDVIQTSIDKNSVKGRESLVLDRDHVDTKLLEERKKEGNRKSESKKDKDGSIFSSIFGGSKKKEEKEKVGKKSQNLQVPEELPYKPLLPDVDYNWTRFPLLEERAIYRMAHIKLANPRRSLLSQVLLSNFMYSYLAIVQAMHPQMNVPTSPQQKRLDEEARRKRQEQEYLSQQQMQDEEDVEHALDQYNFDYHRAAVQYADSGSDGQVEYVDEAQIYEDEHGNHNHEGYSYTGAEGYGHDSKEYTQHRGNGSDHQRDGRDDMW